MPSPPAKDPLFDNICEALNSHAKQRAEATAFTFLNESGLPQSSLSYSQLEQEAISLAKELSSHNNPKDCILLIFNPGLEFIIAYFACLYAGMIAVPVAPAKFSRSGAFFKNIIDETEITTILANEDIAAKGITYFSLDEKYQQLQWTSVAQYKDSRGTAKLKDIAFVKPDRDDIAFLQYTSGSTSFPKGVMVSHQNLILNIDELHRCYEHDSDTIVVNWIPHFHDLGLIYGILTSLYSGCPCYLIAPASFVRSPLLWLQAISRYKGTHSAAPNSAYQLCIEKIKEPEKENLSLATWKSAANAAEPIRYETLLNFSEQFESCQFRYSAFNPSYGLAEATVKVAISDVSSAPYVVAVNTNQLSQGVVVITDNDEEGSQYLVSSGRVDRDTRSIIVNPTTRNNSAANEVGEIWISGPSIATGYWRRDSETQQTFFATLADDLNSDHYLRSGDMGFIRDNNIFVTGRIKDLIILGGVNYYPQDIELSAIHSDEALNPDHAAAFSVVIEGTEHVVIAIEIKRTFAKNIDPAAIFKKVQRAVFSNHEISLHDIVLVRPATTLKTSSGKIQRSANKAAYLANELQVIESLLNIALPTDDSSIIFNRPGVDNASPMDKFSNIQQWLIRVIENITGLEGNKINPSLDFSQLGIKSNSILTIATRIEQQLSTNCSTSYLFDYPNINELAHFLSKEARPADSFQKEQPSNHDAADHIAIVGLSCRFPGAESTEDFWSALTSAKDCISQRNGNSQWGGFLSKIDEFDPEFFNISPREAQEMDPHQRLLLEVSWEALEDAGISVNQLRDTKTAVFFGQSNTEFQRISYANPNNLSMYTATGSSPSIASGRLSYLWSLKGPALTIDTACSSSLVAVHKACESIRSGESDFAFAGGVNLLITPESTISLTRGKMLSPDGRCKTFDQSANGYVRGEGCGVVFLKRLNDAKRDGDDIYAVIRGSSINQDGATTGLTAPNGRAQRTVVRSALNNACISANQISYVEAHGTGTPLGDPVELGNLCLELSEQRNSAMPCWIGSVKTNIGHLEAAAGIAGLIKTALAIKHAQIPANLHFDQLNKQIKFDQDMFSIPTENQPWSGERYAGVSSFGFSGTNAHIVLADSDTELEKNRSVTEETGNDSALSLLALSATSQKALNALAQSHSEQLLKIPNTPSNWIDYSFSNNTSRSLHSHRLVINSDSCSTASEILEHYATGGTPDQLTQGIAPFSTPNVTFLFSGQGAQFTGMLKQLYYTEPVIQETLNYCNAIASECLGYDLLDVMFNKQISANRALKQTINTQPALLMCEVALARLWQSKGVNPNMVLGHSIGEFAAAHIAGVLSLSDALKLVLARGRYMQALPTGRMIAVIANQEQLDCCFGVLSPDDRSAISIAAINGRENLVVSGQEISIKNFVDILDADTIPHIELDVSHAFHSPMMEPVIDDFEKVLDTITFNTPSIPLISNLTGEYCNEDICSKDYWLKHTLAPVNFHDSIHYAARQGAAVFIEIGPGSALTNLGKKSLNEDHYHWLTSTSHHANDQQDFFHNLGRAFCLGADIAWTEFPGSRRIRELSIPKYPFQRKRFWPDVDASDFSISIHPLLGSKTPLADGDGILYTKYLNEAEHQYLTGHVINGLTIFPGAGYLEIAYAAAAQQWGSETISCENVQFHQPLVLKNIADCIIQTQVISENDKQAKVDIFSSSVPDNYWTLHSSLTINCCDVEGPSYLEVNGPGEIDELPNSLCAQDFYHLWNGRGNAWRDSFQGIENLWVQKNSAWGRVSTCNINSEQLSDYCLHPALLDACAQVFAALFQETRDGAFVGHSVERITYFNRPTSSHYWVHAQIDSANRTSASNQEIGNLSILDDSHLLIARLSGLRFSFLGEERQHQPNLQTIKLVWEESPEDTGSSPVVKDNPLCLIVHNYGDAEIASTLSKQFQTAGYRTNTMVLDAATCASTLSDSQADIIINYIDQNEADSISPEVPFDSFVRQLDSLKRLILDLETSQTKLWVLTSNSVHMGSYSNGVNTSVNPLNAALWGFARSASIEQASNWGGIIDLDRSISIDDQCEVIVASINENPWSNQLAIRNTQLYRARLSAVAYSEALGGSFSIRSESSYLITGGLGDLGLQWAVWLAREGARRLLLISRTGLPPRTSWHTELHNPDVQSKISTISALEKLGVQITTVSLDISHEEVFTEWLEQYQLHHPEIVGVIHAAGTARHLSLGNISENILRQELGGKMVGASVIDRFFPAGTLDFLILFSSASALLASPFLSAYATSNAYLDGMAAKRRLLSSHDNSVSIQWGSFSDIGLMARSNEALSQKGINPERATQLTPALVQLTLRENACSLLVLSNTDDSINQLNSLDEIRNYAYLDVIDEVAKHGDLALDDEGVTTYVDLEKLNALSIPDRLTAIESWLLDTVSTVLGIDIDRIDQNKSFTQHGLDSLMALQVKSSIERSFSISIPVFDILKNDHFSDLAIEIGASLSEANRHSGVPQVLAKNEQQTRFDQSYNQRAQWFIHQIDPLSCSYHVSFSVRIVSGFSARKFDRLMSVVMDENPSFRTNFSFDNRPIQEVTDRNDFRTTIVSASDRTDDEIRELVKESFQQPFCLQSDLLIRAHSFEIGEHESILLIVAHHIVCDGWSLWSLLDQIKSLYLKDAESSSGHTAEKGPDLHFPGYTFADFVSWQDDMLQDSKGKQLWNYWQNTLHEIADLNQQLALPYDKKLIVTQDDKANKAGQSLHFKLPEQLSINLRKIAREQSTTLFSVLLSGYQLMLHKITNQQELLVGTPYHGRSHIQFENIVGNFVNLVPIRSSIRKNQTIADYLSVQNSYILEALTHGDYPLSLMIDKLGINRVSQKSSLIQTTFVMQKPPRDSSMLDLFLNSDDQQLNGERSQSWGELQLSPYMIPQQEGQFDLYLEMADSGTNLEGFFKFDANLFTEDRICSICEYYLSILRSFETDLDHCTQSISLAREQKGHRPLNIFRTQTPHSLPESKMKASTLTAAFKCAALKNGGGIAVTDGHSELTYTELDLQSNMIANQLISEYSEACRSPGLVGLCTARSTGLVTSIMGILKSGQGYLPLDKDHPGNRLQLQIDEAGVQVVITDYETKAALQEKIGDVTLLCIEELLSSTSSDLQSEPDVDIDSNSLAYLIYTSGSTGVPKGVMIEHGHVVNLVNSLADCTFDQLEDQTCIALVANCIFDASVQQIFSSLLLGHKLFVVDEYSRHDAMKLADTFIHHNVKVSDFTPSLLGLLVDYLEAGETRLPLELLLVGGEPLPSSLSSRFLEMHKTSLVVNVYGPTECCVDSTYFPVRYGDTIDENIVPIGYPLSHVDIHIVDQWNQTAPPGVSGEILIEGGSISRGYINSESTNQLAFTSLPELTEKQLYRTGDYGYWSDTGVIHYLERIDQQVKIRGYRIELEEIATNIRHHSMFSDCCVIANAENTSLIAYVIRDDNSSETQDPAIAEMLKEYLSNYLPNYMIPNSFMVLDKLPLTSNGKLNKNLLPPIDPGSTNLGGQANSDIEIEIAAVWRETLNLEQVGREDNFFDLGGHSLLLAHVQQRLNALFDKKLSMTDLFSCPTISSLAALYDISKDKLQQERSQTTKSKKIDMRKQQITRQRANRKVRRDLTTQN